MKNSNLNNKFQRLNRQPLVFYLITSFTFLLILIRLIFLQLLNHETYKQMSDESPKPTFIRTLEPPSYFGEYALLASSPRTASVIAASNNCSCYMLHKEAFSCLFPVNKVMRCRQFLESEKIFERHPAFNQLPPLVLSHLRDIMHPAIYSKGDLVAERGTVQK